MKVATVAIVAAGVLLSIALGLRRGFDATGASILVLILAVGAISVAVANRSDRGVVEPARCEECGGLISANAPLCKHCGARRA